jgi:uncharacterized paraquat-inducible protein A
MVEPLRLNCPKCQAKLRAPRHLLGQMCPCPRCGANVVVQLPFHRQEDADVALVFPGMPTDSAAR